MHATLITVRKGSETGLLSSSRLVLLLDSTVRCRVRYPGSLARKLTSLCVGNRCMSPSRVCLLQ